MSPKSPGFGATVSPRGNTTYQGEHELSQRRGFPLLPPPSNCIDSRSTSHSRHSLQQNNEKWNMTIPSIFTSLSNPTIRDSSPLQQLITILDSQKTASEMDNRNDPQCRFFHREAAPSRNTTPLPNTTLETVKYARIHSHSAIGITQSHTPPESQHSILPNVQNGDTKHTHSSTTTSPIPLQHNLPMQHIPYPIPTI